MKPSKPFLFCVALVTLVGTTVFLNAPAAQAATTEQGMPLSTKLTPAMIDYFGLEVAYQRPSMQRLAACGALPECGDSDSSRVRFFDSTGVEVPAWDGKPGSVIEQVRVLPGAELDHVSEWRREVRQYATDAQGRVVMQGTDSIVRVDAGAEGRAATRITQVNRYTNVRYLVTDPRFIWPLTGLVVLELSNEIGAAATSGPAGRTAGHGAVSFDGTGRAHIITTGALTHSADLVAKRLETTVPDR